MQNNVIKTAGRVFEVLEYFREVQKPLSVREISERFDYPLSSTSVLLKSLATLGYLSYEQSIRAYFPTVRVASLGDWIFESMFSGGDLLALLHEIAETTGETAVLAVMNDVFSQYVQVIPSRRHSIQFQVPPGTRRFLCASGTGWMLLSQESDDTITQFYNRTVQKFGKDFSGISLDKVLEKVEQVRQQGYAFSQGFVTEGAGLIAIPVPEGSSGAKLVIGVAGVLSRLEDEEARIVKNLHSLVDKHYGLKRGKRKV